MELLLDLNIKQLKQDLFEIYKDEIKVKINDLEKTFEENGYIILQPMNYINRNLTDLEIIDKKNFNNDEARNICTELAIEQFINKLKQDYTQFIDKTRKGYTKSNQRKYTWYEFNDRDSKHTIVVIQCELTKELPTGSELYQAIRYSRRKNSDGSYKRNIKINVEDSENELKKIFLGILLHTKFNIKQPTANTLRFDCNPCHKPKIKSGYLSLYMDYYDSVKLLDEDNQIIDPDYYVPLDLTHICKDRSSIR